MRPNTNDRGDKASNPPMPIRAGFVCRLFLKEGAIPDRAEVEGKIIYASFRGAIIHDPQLDVDVFLPWSAISAGYILER